MTIRDYRSADFERLLAIDQAAFAPELAYSRYELRTYLSGRRSRTLVAEGADGAAVGFVVGRLAAGRVGYLITLDVAPGHQGSGIGGRLLAAIERWLEESGARGVALHTPADSAGARRFYERHGYRALDRLAGYYHGRLDAFLMLKRLGPEGGEP
ncbi:MAG TPA: N-acetyltransferase [Thermoanaerobaculia bacterium]|nr:N-acetyltransferase [Thermoanaerobaculia bacterium]